MNKIQNDLASYWMPFTPNRDFKSDPRMVVSADRMHYKSVDGRDILDSCAGLWCVNAGHNRPLINKAVQDQVGQLDYAPPLLFGHSKAFELANRLALMFPGDLDNVFFTNSGSEAADTALKIALAYQKARGQGGRYRIIGRERSYHGVGFGGISVGGMVANRRQFATLHGVDHMRHTHDLKRNAFSRGLPQHGEELADDLERMVALHDVSSIAAVIVEPVAGSTGVLPPPKGYLRRLRKICDKHDILLIFDEVITAFGRLGKASASELFGVQPDIMALAKGLTNAVIPMGAVITSKKVHDTIVDNSATPMELFHGYTYSGHPVAVAACLATLDTYQQEDLFEKSASLHGYFEDAIHSLKGLPNVVDIRNVGLMGAVELAPRSPSEAGVRGYASVKQAWDMGLMQRVVADTLTYSPPLIVEKTHIDQMFDTAGKIIKSLD